MDDKDKKIKFDIDNGQSFFADEIGVIHTPLKIILDFKNITPRIDIRNSEFQPVVLRHNVVVMDPFMAKSFSEILSQNIKMYEKNYGKINKPAALKNVKTKKEKAIGEKDSPNYFG